VSRVLPIHAPCGISGLGEELEPAVFVCALRRTWAVKGHVDALGCGRLFALCQHGQRGCLCCHRNEPPAQAVDRVRALVFLAHRDGVITHDASRVTLASLADLHPEGLAGIAGGIVGLVAPGSLLARGAREIIAEIASLPRAA